MDLELIKKYLIVIVVLPFLLIAFIYLLLQIVFGSVAP